MKYFPDYKHLLQELYATPQLEEFQLSIIFQQNDAPPHWGSHVRRFLDATFPNRWIGRDGPTPWPPRSPDITPLDFYLWGMLRKNCFRHQFQILQIWRRFCYNNWRHVGEHVERNWLSVRRSPRNKRSACWSVLMCCKKNFLNYILRKKNMFVFHVQQFSCNKYL